VKRTQTCYYKTNGKHVVSLSKQPLLFTSQKTVTLARQQSINSNKRRVFSAGPWDTAVQEQFGEVFYGGPQDTRVEEAFQDLPSILPCQDVISEFAALYSILSVQWTRTRKAAAEVRVGAVAATAAGSETVASVPAEAGSEGLTSVAAEALVWPRRRALVKSVMNLRVS
jgi:hypothetical protein